VDLLVRLRVEGGLPAAAKALVARPSDSREQRETDEAGDDDGEHEEIH
jgi:hypothetical protein